MRGSSKSLERDALDRDDFEEVVGGQETPGCWTLPKTAPLNGPRA